MKRILAAIAILSFGLEAGCHAQVPPTPPLYTAPTPGNSAYTPLNPVGGTPAPTTAMTYVDTPPAGTQSCYVVQGYLPGPQYSPWSNTACGAPGTTGKANLSWSCTPTTGTTCTGVLWIVSRTAAVVATAPAIPTLNAPTSAEVTPAPESAPAPVLAKNMPSPIHLTITQ